MKTKIISALFATVASVASAEVLLWHHFDERAPGETTLASDTLVNAASPDFGSAKACSINNVTFGTDEAFMPRYAAPAYAELKDIIFDPVSGEVYTNRSSISFRTEGTKTDLSGGAIVIDNVSELYVGDFTIECFVCTMGGVFDGIAPIVGMVPSDGFMSEHWQIGMLESGKMFMRFDKQPSSTPPNSLGSRAINDGAWHHLALVCSYDPVSRKSTYRMYVDYRQDFQRDNNEQISYSQKSKIYIGGYAANRRRMLNGMIDEVRFSNTALSPNQFLRRYSRFVNEDTLAYLPFDGIPGTIPTVAYMNYAVCNSGEAVAVEYASTSTTNAVLSNDVYTPTLRDDLHLPPTCTNSTSLSMQTNGVVGTGVGLTLSPYPYTATNFTAELFFKLEGKLIHVGANMNEYSQTLLKFGTSDPQIQLTFNQSNPKTLMLVCHNGYGLEEFKWLTCGYFGEDLDDGNWHHVAVVYDADNSTLSMYLDYLEVYKNRQVRLSEVKNYALVGHGGSSMLQFVHGKIDSVRFTQRALSVGEFLNPMTAVTDIPDDVLFYAPLNGTSEAVTENQIILGDLDSRGFEGCEAPVFTTDVKYPELCLEGKEGSWCVTNTGSIHVKGSQICFRNTDSLGTFDHTTEFYFRLSSMELMSGLIRLNNSSSLADAAPVWAIYVNGTTTRRLGLRCSTVTNGVASTERYLDTTIKLNDIVDGEWHHFAMTTQYNEESDRQHFTIYIDGEKVWTNSLLGYFYDRGLGFNLTMGYSSKAEGNVVGDFDELKITRGVIPPSKFMCRYRRPRGIVVTVR